MKLEKLAKWSSKCHPDGSWLDQGSADYDGERGRWGGRASPATLCFDKQSFTATQTYPYEGVTLFSTWRRNWGHEKVITWQCHTERKWWSQKDSHVGTWLQSLCSHNFASAGFDVQILVLAVTLGNLLPLSCKLILVTRLQYSLAHCKHSTTLFFLLTFKAFYYTVSFQ